MRTPPNERVSSDIAEAAGSRACESERRCILTGKVHPRDALVRLAISPDGVVLPDPGAKAPGRGAWIAPDRAALEAAICDGHFKRALARAFKGGPEGKHLSYSEDLPQQIEGALTRHLTDRLGLELRSGNIVLGASRIEEQARSGRVGLLLHARDSSEGSRKKLDQAWRVGSDTEGSGARGMVLPLDRDTLSVALGRENVVHLGVTGRPGDLETAGKSRAAARIGQAVGRLSSYVGDGLADQAGASRGSAGTTPDENCDDETDF